MRHRYEMLGFFVVFLVLASVFFSPFVLHGRVFVPGDILEAIYPWKYFSAEVSRPHNPLLSDPVNAFYAVNYNRRLHEGSLDWWNPYILTGSPSVSSFSMGYPGRFYPPKLLLHFLLPTAYAVTVLLYLHVFLMGYFMYLYLRSIGTPQWGSLFGAVAYMFNGCAMVWLEFECWVYTSALLPLLLLLFEKYLLRKSYVHAVLSGIVLGLIVLTGNPQLCVYVLLMIFAYFVLMIARAGGVHIRPGPLLSICSLFLVTGAVGVSIGAVEWMPLVEAVGQGSRVSDSYGFSALFERLGRLPLRYLVTLIFPDFFGSPITGNHLPPALPGQTYMNYTELCLYTGIPTVFAFIAGALSRRNVFARFYLVMTILVLLMIAGTVVYYPVFALVPGMDKVNPVRMIFLFVFGFAVVAGQGIDEIPRFTRPRRYLFVSLSLTALALIILLAIFASNLSLSAWFNLEQFRPLKSEDLPRLTELVRIREITSPVIYRPLILSLLSVVLLLGLTILRKGRSAVLIVVALTALLAYDLGSFGRRYNTTVPAQGIYRPTPAIEYLVNQERPFRIAQAYWNLDSANTFAPFGIEDLGGYSSYMPQGINALLSYMQFGASTRLGLKFDRWAILTNLSSPLIDLLNVRYVVLPPGGEIADEKFRLVYNRELSIYENKRVMPRIFGVQRYRVIRGAQEILRYMTSSAYQMSGEVILEADPPGDFLTGVRPLAPPAYIAIDRYDPDEIVVSVDFASNGWLVVSDAFFPGWEAHIDGNQVPIVRANFNFRALACHSGRHTVTLAYRPSSCRWGAIITIVGLAVALSGIVACGLARTRASAK